MNTTEVERFIQDVNQNQDLLEKLSSGELGLDGLVGQARELGYSFTAEDAKEFAKHQSDGEIDDESLQLAAGGYNNPTAIVIDHNPVVLALLILP